MIGGRVRETGDMEADSSTLDPDPEDEVLSCLLMLAASRAVGMAYGGD